MGTRRPSIKIQDLDPRDPVISEAIAVTLPSDLGERIARVLISLHSIRACGRIT